VGVSLPNREVAVSLLADVTTVGLPTLDQWPADDHTPWGPVRRLQIPIADYVLIPGWRL